MLLNSLYYKKNYLEDGHVVIILGEVNISNTPVYLQLNDAPPKPAIVSTAELKALDLCIIGVAIYAWYSKKKDYELMAVLLRDIDKALEQKKRPDPAILLPEDYHDFLDMFSRLEFNKLPPHRPYNYDIPLMPGMEPLP